MVKSIATRYDKLTPVELAFFLFAEMRRRTKSIFRGRRRRAGPEMTAVESPNPRLFVLRDGVRTLFVIRALSSKIRCFEHSPVVFIQKGVSWHGQPQQIFP